MNYLDFLKAPGRYDLTERVTVSYYSRYPDTDPDAPASDDMAGVTLTLDGNVSVHCADYDSADMNAIAAACQLVRVVEHIAKQRIEIPMMTQRTWDEPAFDALIKFMVRA